jgi:hypothetical protein
MNQHRTPTLITLITANLLVFGLAVYGLIQLIGAVTR